MTVVEIEELPIGPGQRRRVKASGGGAGAVDDHRAEELARPAPPVAPAPPALVAVPDPLEPAAEWDPSKMRRPLQIVVGKTVNWRMRKQLGIETSAGLMSDDHADAINEPLAEIFNRFEPLRAIAAKQTEISLTIAIYDYVQATVVQAGRDMQALEDGHLRAAAARATGTYDEHNPEPPPHLFEEERTRDE